MSMQTETNSNLNVADSAPSGGTQLGQSISDLIGFYGTTPQTQPTNAAQAAVTDSSGGAASATSGVQALTSSYNSTILGNAIATVLAQSNQLRAALVSLGLIKGA